MFKLNYAFSLLYFCTVSFLCWGSPPSHNLPESETVIDFGWKYRQVGETTWSSASVPGCIHTDLLGDKKISDPSFRLNEKDQQWIGETDWEYMTTFEVSESALQNEHVELIFEGLDTYADVYLNGERILRADNMFRTWELEVKPRLKAGQNELRIYFHNIFKVNQPRYDSAEYRLQAFSNNDQADVKLSLYSRKAGFHYGWDWGPRLITAGIWRPIKLRSWSNFRIKNAHYRQTEVSSEKATLSAEFEVFATADMSTEIIIQHDENQVAKKRIELSPGLNKVVVPFSIQNPDLWWTNGLGEQPLYTFDATLEAPNGKVEKNRTRIGIRSIEVVREEDKFGKSLYIKLNGVPVFVKGANYIPQDNFQSRVTSNRYEHIIESAQAANMNMLRVWGGGVYEEDIFYSLCDEKGLLVWQDIMFACGMFPADEGFLANVKQEVIDNVSRLRNHPSVALYCGNNENEISWYSWGWKDLYEPGTQQKYEEALKKLFYETIPDAIATADPDRYYHPSSPIAGIGENRPKEEGDTHYWGVWHGKEPFRNFEDNISRFVSEYGFQSYPEFSSIKKFSIDTDWDLESEVMHAHQRCMADDRKDIDYGNRLINTYLQRNFSAPNDFKSYIYVVQALQAKGVKMAVESHRRNRTDNYCMGTLYWQINDCWPAASWSSIDYYGKWKALHYLVKNAYAPLLITANETEDSLGIFVVSDQLAAIEKAEVKVQVLDFQGREIQTITKEVNIAPNTSRKYLSLNVADLLANIDRNTGYLKMTVRAGEEVLSENRYFFETEKALKLPRAEVTYTARKVSGGYEVTLSSETLAKYVWISLDHEEAFISDNYFDLDAHESRTLTIETDVDLGDLGSKLRIISLTDSY